ncbi:MAG: RAMP superfamily CRISPR-associated protein [Pseudomonadota bacterium]
MPESKPPSRGLRFALAHVTLELTTPMTIGTGGGDDLRDSTCVLDANGLPTIPATSLAGMLRAAWAARKTRDEVEALFGFQRGVHGAPSRVELSWAAVHGAKDLPVPPRVAPEALIGDPVLAFLEAGVVRDHVRLDHKGVVDRAGKFDELLVPAGARFTFELLVHAPDEEKTLIDLLALLHRGGLRLGGRTRRGFGSFKVARCASGSFDLRRAQDRAAFARVPRDLAAPGSGLTETRPEQLPAPEAPRDRVRVELSLRPQDHWLFGTGTAVRPEHRTREQGREGKAHDKVPVTERRIRWSGGQGSVVSVENAEVLVPASGIKGALRHRTLFHARRRAGQWALDTVTTDHLDDFRQWAEAPDRERPDPLGGEHSGDVEQAVAALFGSIKRARDADDAEDAGLPGRVFLTDLYLDPAEARSGALQHVSLDRFTQAPMDGLLYSEAPISRSPKLMVTLDIDREGVPPLALQALADALEDLAAGRLALGAGANRGHGYFTDPDANVSGLHRRGDA